MIFFSTCTPFSVYITKYLFFTLVIVFVSFIYLFSFVLYSFPYTYFILIFITIR
uniref:Uncharacterized protein n=1 Tax=Heterorhabditis bacteriophora TaxID=37862 RepID=A0A1I7W634_HETBA